MFTKNTSIVMSILAAICTGALYATEMNSTFYPKNKFRGDRIAKSSMHKSKQMDPGALLAINLLFEACIGHRHIARHFHPRGMGKAPSMTLFIPEIFEPGRRLGDTFDQPFIDTQKVYDTKIEELRQGAIKTLIETRDISFEYTGHKLGKLIQQGASKFPAYKYGAFAIGLELFLEEKYIDGIFPTNRTFSYAQKIKTVTERIEKLKEKNKSNQHGKNNQKSLNPFDTESLDKRQLEITKLLS